MRCAARKNAPCNRGRLKCIPTGIWNDMRLLHTCKAEPLEKAIDDEMIDEVMNDY